MQTTKPTHVRYLILLMLFLVTTINYADRATIAIAGSSLQKTSASTRSPSVTSSPHSVGPTWPGKFPVAGCWTVSARKSLCAEHFHLVTVHRAARLCG